MKHARDETNELPCELTDEEKIDRGEKLAKATQEVEEIDAERKRVAADYSAKLKLARTRRDELAITVATGKEKRRVECRVFADIKQAAYITCRNDTGDEVRRRPMSSTELEHERQADLPLDEEPERPRPPAELLKEGANPNDQRKWLESNGFPWCVGPGFARRNQALLIAIDQDDYDEGAAEAAFGDLEWPETEEDAS